MRFLRSAAALYVDAVFLQLGDLFGENHRIDHHAVADDIDRAFAENTRRDRVQYVFLPSNGVSGLHWVPWKRAIT